MSCYGGDRITVTISVLCLIKVVVFLRHTQEKVGVGEGGWEGGGKLRSLVLRKENKT